MVRGFSGRTVLRALAAACLLLCATTAAWAQTGGSAATLTGSVVDNDGGVIPGATVEVKNNATGVVESVVTNASGVFSVPGLNPGTYSVTVSLSGFKTSVVSDVRLIGGTTSQVKAVLQVGALTETVEVRGGATLVQTQSATVTSTLTTEQIMSLPLVSRNGLNAVSLLPGVTQTGAVRNSTINGLPQNTINIAIDGISVSNNLQSGDGFYAQVFPRMDAVEEITVTGATPGADGGALGSVQIGFVTRSGSNQFDTSLYHYYRSPRLNTNYYFNEYRGLPKNDVRVHQFGGRVGGPVVRGKAFFFANYEQFYLPNEATRNRTILSPEAQSGIFRYDVAGAIRSVNVLQLAATNNQLATQDPTIAALLGQIRTAALTSGSITQNTNPNTQAYARLAPSQRDEYAPTGRLDYNLTDRHRISGTYYWQRIISRPDFLNSSEPAFPGFPNQGDQTSYRKTGSLSVRSTLSSAVVNEAKFGFQTSPVDFYSDLGIDSFSNQNGYAVTLGFGLSNAHVVNAPNKRNTPSWSLENSLNWLAGSHSIKVGATFMNVTNISNAWNIAPTITLGIDQTNDPANAMFTTANFTGASTANLADARALYALLTGRVTAIGGTARQNVGTGNYVYLGGLEQRAGMKEFGVYAQDSWRVTPTLTLNGGLRWEVQLPFQGLTNTWSSATLTDLCGISGIGSGPQGQSCNMFKPGTIGNPGVVPKYTAYDANNPGYDTKWTNVAPNLGLAWRPNVQSGFLRTLLGDPDQATIRAGYSLSYNRERMDRFTGLIGNNPGGTTAANRNVTNGNLVLAGESWPVLFRQTTRLGPPVVCADNNINASCMPRAPIYPIIATTSNNINIYDPEITLPYVQSWSVGVQRALGADSAIEVRYIGNQNTKAWGTEDWNERVLEENGFLAEFRKAQANLAANIAAGKGNTFAYRTDVAGSQPLPIYLAHLNGRTDATNAAAYTGANWTNTTLTGRLAYFNPSVGAAANDLYNDATRRAAALAAGLPANFFAMNPQVGSANIMRSSGGSRYHSMQIEYRRRLSKGLLVNASYTYARSFSYTSESLARERFYLESAGVPHALRVNWTYEIPVGRGRRIGADWNPVVNAILGNWEFSGTTRVQIQSFSVTGARLVGMTKDQLQDAFKIRRANDPTTGVLNVYSMPDDIILNTRRAYSVSATTANGYSALGAPEGRYIAPASTRDCVYLFEGDCGSNRFFINAPPFKKVDVRMTKKFPFLSRASADLSIEFMNVFNTINENAVLNPGTGATIFQVTSGYRDTGVDVNDPGGRIGQIVWRISW
jgi:Carboxypeptidase regulatory-like domain/TonB dependent receptor